MNIDSKNMMPQRYDKYKIKAILLFSIIICLFAMRFIYYSTLLKHVEDKADFDCGSSNTIFSPLSFCRVICDGTEVWLNANSNFVYPTAFIGDERIVTLEGEAYFKVAKDPERPFIVKTKTVQTRVLGTEFNIRSYTPEDTHVVLINGKVEVSNTKGGSYTRLYPGEDAHLQSDGNFILAEVDLDSYVYRKDGYFYFDNVTLKDIMQNLGRWYNVNIEFRNKEAMEYKMHFISDRTKDLEHTISLLNRMKKVIFCCILHRLVILMQ